MNSLSDATPRRSTHPHRHKPLMDPGSYGRTASHILPTWPACVPFHSLAHCGGVWQWHNDEDSWERHETCCHSHLAINAKNTQAAALTRPKRDSSKRRATTKTINNNREMRQKMPARPGKQQAFRLYGIINS